MEEWVDVRIQRTVVHTYRCLVSRSCGTVQPTGTQPTALSIQRHSFYCLSCESQNKVTDWERKTHVRIREVFGSNLSRNTGHPDRFAVTELGASKQVQWYYLAPFKVH